MGLLIYQKIAVGISLNNGRLRNSCFLTEKYVCKFSESFTEIELLDSRKGCHEGFLLHLDRKKRLGIVWRYRRNTTIFALNFQGWRQEQGLSYPLNGRGLGPSTAAYLGGHLLILYIMGILKNLINAKVSGNVGSMNFRRRGSQVVVAERSYSNSSKGGGASYKQRLHRVRIANVANVFRAISNIEARAWQFKDGNKSDANMFFAANLANSPVFLTAEQAKNGAAVIAPYVVSEGTLPALEQSFDSNTFHTGIKMPAEWIVGQNTIGALSMAIIANNEGVQNGDKFTFAKITQTSSIINGKSYPMIGVTYFELTLDSNSFIAVASLPNYELMSFAVEENEIVCTDGSDAAFVIHSRLLSNKLYTSTQMVSMKAELPVFEEFTSEAQKAKAMDSYGYKPDVLLTPDIVGDLAEIEAAVESISYNEQPLVSGSSVQPGQKLVISGKKLNRSNCYVANAGVVLVPQVDTEAKQEFTISRGGSLTIVVNGTAFLTCSVEVREINITKLEFNGSSYETPQSNLQAQKGMDFSIKVEGENLGEVTATGGVQLQPSSPNTDTVKVINVLMPSEAGTAWTISCGGIVIFSGTTV